MRYTREQACLAWLAQGMLGSRRLKKLLDEYGSAEAAYDAFQRDNGASLQNRISDYSLSLLRASASREKLHDMLVTMRKWYGACLDGGRYVSGIPAKHSRTTVHALLSG